MKIPVIVLGIGIQTDFEYNLENLKPIEKEAKRFLKEVLERSPSIGVRGHATKAFIQKLGFSDEQVDVIGCPSMFRYGENFSIDLSKLDTLSKNYQYALNITGPGFDSSGFKTGKEKILDIVNYNMENYGNVDVLLQNNYSLLTMLWGRGLGKGIEYDGVSKKSQAILDSGHAKQFIDPSKWIEFLGGKSFSLGTRIHGNIAALLAGTPCFVLSTDSRTRELCEYFDIPFARADRVDGLEIADFADKADYTKLLQRYNERFYTYIKFLRKNNLENCFESVSKARQFEDSLNNIQFPESVSGVEFSSRAKYDYWFRRGKQKISKVFA